MATKKRGKSNTQKAKASKKSSTTETLVSKQGTKTKGTTVGDVREVDSAKLGETALAEKEVLGPAKEIEAAKIDPVREIEAAQIDRTAQNEFRGRQMALADQLAAQSRGEGPSIAGLQYRENADRAIASQMAMARSGGGALARRQAQFGQAQINQEAARQSAMIRMSEQMNAQQGLAGVLNQGRVADINLDTSQAQLNQGANISNQQAFNEALMRQADLNQQANISNQGAYNTNQAQQAQLNQNVALANADAMNRAMQAQAGMDQQATLANQSAYNNAISQQASINQAIEQSRISAGATMGAAAAGAGASRYATDAGLYKFNQSLGFQMDQYYQDAQNQTVNSGYNAGQNTIAAQNASRERQNGALGNIGATLTGSAGMFSSGDAAPVRRNGAGGGSAAGRR